MVSLIMSLESNNISTSASCITCPKSHAAPDFDHVDLRNAMVPLMTLSASHDAIDS